MFKAPPWTSTGSDNVSGATSRKACDIEDNNGRTTSSGDSNNKSR